MSSNNFKLGRTLPGESRKNRELELARLAARKRRKIRKAILTTLLVIACAAVVVWIAYGIINLIRDANQPEGEINLTEPTVSIIDENAGDNISTRVKEFVAKIERDFYDLGYSVDHVVLPLQKAREVDIYVVGRTEFYKMSVDRGSATQAEDAERMIRYLDEKGIKASYVDLRVEGKAYYK
ncbi:MAG: hypothetical protein ACK5MU_03215 [Candidatus Saccharimonadales bacterium]